MKFGVDVMPLEATLYSYFEFPTIDHTNMVYNIGSYNDVWW
jgi:hypothetical protein